MKFLSSLFQRYTHSLTVRPYTTKMATSFFVFSSGDFICQRYIEKRSAQHYDYTRTFRQAVFGTLMVAPTLHIWHSKMIPVIIKPFQSRFKQVAVSYALGEGLLSPYFLMIALFYYGYTKKFDFEEGRANLNEKFLTTLLRSFQFWGIVSMFTYSIVPIIYRPVWTNCFSIAWQAYLSHVANAQRTTEHLEELEDIDPYPSNIAEIEAIEHLQLASLLSTH